MDNEDGRRGRWPESVTLKEHEMLMATACFLGAAFRGTMKSLFKALH